MISEKISKIYISAKRGKINKEKAIDNILEIIDSLYLIPEDSIECAIEIIEKSIYYISNLDGKSEKVYKFLEECILDNQISINGKRGIYIILRNQYPSKIKPIQEYILTHINGFFPEGLYDNGMDIIKSGLTDFLFKTIDVLKSYFPTRQYKFLYNSSYQGFTNNLVYITTKENNIYTADLYGYKTNYELNELWKFDKKNNRSCYLIEGKYKLELMLLNFCVHIFTALIDNFNETDMILAFSNDDDIPAKVSYKGSNIVIFIFNRDKELQEEVLNIG